MQYAEVLEQCLSLSTEQVTVSVGTTHVQAAKGAPDAVGIILSNLAATDLSVYFGSSPAATGSLYLPTGGPPLVLSPPVFWPLAQSTLWVVSSAASGLLGIVRMRADVG